MYDFHIRIGLISFTVESESVFTICSVRSAHLHFNKYFVQENVPLVNLTDIVYV